MFAKRILIALVFIEAAIVLSLFNQDLENSPLVWMAVIPLATAAVIWTLKDPINEWWYARNPTRLSAKEVNFLEHIFPYYGPLNTDHKLRFEYRLRNFSLQKEFMMPGNEAPPPDIRLLLSACATQLTMGFNDKDYILPKFGVFVLYERPFITPNVPTKPHMMELSKEEYDVIVISMDFFTMAIRQPDQHYNIAMHVLAKALQWQIGNQDSDIPGLILESKESLAAKINISRGFRPGFLPEYLGTEDTDLFPLCVEYFFTRPANMKADFPDIYNYLVKTLGQDPGFADCPLPVKSEVV